MEKNNKKIIKDISIFILISILFGVMFFTLMFLCSSLDPKSIYSYLTLLVVLLFFIFISFLLTNEFILYLKKPESKMEEK